MYELALIGKICSIVGASAIYFFAWWWALEVDKSIKWQVILSKIFFRLHIGLVIAWLVWSWTVW